MKKQLAILFFLMAFSLAACNLSLAQDITPPPNYVQPTAGPTLGVSVPVGAPSPAHGKVIYAEKCAACHGDDGLGNGPKAGELPVPVSAIGLRDIASQSNPASWYTILTQGRMDRYMPPFASLSEADRWDVLAYTYTLSNTSSMQEQGVGIYAELCASCHGAEGEGGGSGGSSVNLADPAYDSQVTGLGLYSAISRGFSPQMPPFESLLDENEIWAVVAFLRTLSYDMSVPVLQVQSPTIEPTATATSSAPSPTAQLTGTGVEATSQATPLIPSEPSPSPTAKLTSTPEGLFGTLTGNLSNGSGGEVSADQTITLHGFIKMNETVTLTSSTDEQGTYVFTNVPLESGVAFVVSTEFQGLTYNSDVVSYDGTTTEFELPLTIYDTTTDSSSITADRLHIFFDFSNTGLVQVIEIYILSNSSNKAVVPGGDGGFVQSYILPEGASNLQFEFGSIGDPYIQTDTGFGDPTAILPGASSYQMLFAFNMPYGKNLEISQQLNTNIGSVLVMAPDGVKVKSDQLTDSGQRDVQGTPFNMFSMESTSAGDILTLTLSGTPKAASDSFNNTSDESQTNLVLGLGIFGGVLIVAGVFFFLRGRSQRHEPDEGEDDSEDSLGKDAEQLMDAIASLDDQFKAGSIKEDAYRKRRTDLKQRLKDLL